MPGTSHRARYALGSTVVALSLALLVGALPYLRGASADDTRELIRVTFRPSSAQPRDGWRADHGEAYDSRRAYGWVRDNATGEPIDMGAFAASRSSSTTPPLNDTFITMQPPHKNWGRWVMDVANGTYRVTASVGDAAAEAGSQNLAIEDQRVIEGFVPTSSQPKRIVTTDVKVTDGRLTVDPLYPDATSKTKLMWLVVSVVLDDGEPPTTEPPTTAPPTTAPSTTASTTTTTQPTTTIPPITIPPTTLPPSGLRNQMGFAGGGTFLSNPDDVIQRELDGMAATGATWLRIGFLWSALEPKAPGQYSWAKLDKVVGWARARGLKLVANVSYTPKWARPAGCDDMTCPPTDPALYARFMGALVRHYSPLGVKTYEVWNEPNQYYWWKPRPNPRAYADLLRRAYLQAHLADPTVTVLAGAFAPARDNESGTTMNPRTFLNGMYQAGIVGQFDALSFHPYSGDQDPRIDAYWNMMTGVGPDLVAIMNSHGDLNKKIWGTEMAYSTYSGAKGVTEGEQARLLKLAIEEWRTQDWAGPLFFFTYRDLGTNRSAIADNYGLVKRDFTPKLAAGAMRYFLTGQT
jgi:hypothetical protein